MDETPDANWGLRQMKEKIEMEQNILKIEGIEYKVRYYYKDDLGNLRAVLLCDGGLMGKFGDEWVVQYANGQKNTFTIK